MSTYGWSEFLGASIEGRYLAVRLLRAESRMATFAGHHLEGIEQREILITTLRGSAEDCQLYLRRFREAQFFEHPNLLKVLDAGETNVNGVDAVFAVAEPVSGTLQSAEGLSQEQTLELGSELVAALEYLHSENLVYCALRPESVFRAEGRWKLGDYHQLRLSGSGRIAETRALMGRMPEVPPEAFEGVVTPAWDVWSLGVTLSRVLRREGGERRETGDRRPAPLPPRFEAIVNGCLDPNPANRITLAELAQRLGEPAPSTAGPQPALSTRETSRAADPPPVATAAVAGDLAQQPYMRRGRATTRLLDVDPPPPSRRWLVFPIAGAIAGIALTVLGLDYYGKPDTPPAKTGEVGKDPGAGRPGPSQAGLSKPNPADVPTVATEAEADRASSTPNQRIHALLNRWVASTRSRNVDQQMNCYTNVVDRFYGKRQLSASELRSEKARQFSTIGAVHRFDISDVRIRLRNPTSALVAFKKDWDFGSFAGSEQDELAVKLVYGEWKITGERGKKVYWVRRPKNPPERGRAGMTDLALRRGR